MTLDDRLQRAVDALGDKFRGELTRELQSLSEDWQAQLPPPPPPAPPVDTTAVVRLADAVRALDSATSLADLLETLATSASNEAARAGVFLVRDDEVRSFRVFSFPARYEDGPITLPLGDAGVLRDAIAQRTTAISESSPFDDLPPGVTAIAMPLALAGTVIGALYVEGADVPTMEILTRFASRALEAQTAMKTARAIAEGV
jgi:hypothetical protein